MVIKEREDYALSRTQEVDYNSPIYVQLREAVHKLVNYNLLSA
ncbi:hypothetical protein [Muricomes intestini]